MNLICKLLGHSFEPKTKAIGEVYTDFIYYARKMKCKRCPAFYKTSYLEPIKKST